MADKEGKDEVKRGGGVKIDATGRKREDRVGARTVKVGPVSSRWGERGGSNDNQIVLSMSSEKGGIGCQSLVCKESLESREPESERTNNQEERKKGAATEEERMVSSGTRRDTYTFIPSPLRTSILTRCV